MAEALADVPQHPQVAALAIPCRDGVDAFIVARLPVAARLARRFAPDSAAWDECFQEACLGLVTLVRQMSPAELATSPAHNEALAVLAMRHHIVAALARRAALAPSLTDFGVRRWVQVQRAVRLLARRLGRTPTTDEIAATVGIPTRAVRDLLALTTQPASLEALASDGLDPAAPDAADLLAEALRVRTAIARLPQPERFIIQAQYGIGMPHVSVLALAHTLLLAPRTVIERRQQALTHLRNLLLDV